MSDPAPVPPRPTPPTPFAQGVSFLQAGDLMSASQCFQNALKQEPELVEALYNLGLVTLKQGRPEIARELFERCLQLNPKLRPASTLLARCLLALGRCSEALTRLKQEVEEGPDDPTALHALGLCHLAMDQAQEAQTAFEKALQFHPSHPGLLCNLGSSLQAQNRLNEAMEAYRTLLASQPGHPQARLNLALCLLGSGRLEEAWPHFEARKMLSLEGSARDFPGTPWSGHEPIQGRHLLLHAEQGLGDTLQFIRYLPKLRQAGAILHLEVQAPLLSLLRRIPWLASCHAAGSPLPKVDHHCALASLPGLFDSHLENLPPPNPGLPPDPEQVSRLASWFPSPKSRPRIGLVWAGNPLHPHDRQRSIPLQRLLEALQDLPFEWLSLQINLRQEDRDLLRTQTGLHHLGDRLQDFRDSAALLPHLDLLISVDTAFAHLAGVMGTPAYLLLAKVPDWRWMLDRADSPWYPTLRLFRQQTPGDWGPPLTELRKALAQAFDQG